MTTIINGRLLGQGSNAQMMKANADFSFNGFNLSTDNIRIISHNIDDLGAIDFETYKYAMQDGGGVLGRYFRTRTIIITLSIVAPSHLELMALVDELKYQFSAIEAPLTMKIGDMVRERTATCTSLKFNRHAYNIDWLGDVQVVFQATNPHSHSLDIQKENFTGKTGAYNFVVSYPGRANSYFIVNLVADTTTTGIPYITVNGYTVSAPNSSYTAGTIIEFNGKKKKVSVNGTQVQYNGGFRPLQYGDNTMAINYGGDWSATLSYYENYL